MSFVIESATLSTVGTGVLGETDATLTTTVSWAFPSDTAADCHLWFGHPSDPDGSLASGLGGVGGSGGTLVPGTGTGGVPARHQVTHTSSVHAGRHGTFPCEVDVTRSGVSLATRSVLDLVIALPSHPVSDLSVALVGDPVIGYVEVTGTFDWTAWNPTPPFRSLAAADFGDGTVNNIAWIDSDAVSTVAGGTYTYSAPGTYTVELVVYLPDDVSTEWYRETIGTVTVPPAPPTISGSIDFPTGVAPLDPQIDVSIAAGYADLASWTLTADDGAGNGFTTGGSISGRSFDYSDHHVLTVPGVYTVTASVTDAGGLTATTTIGTVTIAAAVAVEIWAHVEGTVTVGAEIWG